MLVSFFFEDLEPLARPTCLQGSRCETKMKAGMRTVRTGVRGPSSTLPVQACCPPPEPQAFHIKGPAPEPANFASLPPVHPMLQSGSIYAHGGHSTMMQTILFRNCLPLPTLLFSPSSQFSSAPSPKLFLRLLWNLPPLHPCCLNRCFRLSSKPALVMFTSPVHFLL